MGCNIVREVRSATAGERLFEERKEEFAEYLQTFICDAVGAGMPVQQLETQGEALVEGKLLEYGNHLRSVGVTKVDVDKCVELLYEFAQSVLKPDKDVDMEEPPKKKKKKEDKKEEKKDDKPKFPMGQRVRVVKLTRDKSLNGRIGTIDSKRLDGGRYAVKLKKGRGFTKIRIKEGNLEPVPDSEKEIIFQPPFVCPLCGVIFDEVDGLLGHCRLHQYTSKTGRLDFHQLKRNHPLEAEECDKQRDLVIGDRLIEDLIEQFKRRYPPRSARQPYNRIRAEVYQEYNYQSGDRRAASLPCEIVHPVRAAWPEPHGQYSKTHVCT